MKRIRYRLVEAKQPTYESLKIVLPEGGQIVFVRLVNTLEFNWEAHIVNSTTGDSMHSIVANNKAKVQVMARNYLEEKGILFEPEFRIKSLIVEEEQPDEEQNMPDDSVA